MIEPKGEILERLADLHKQATEERSHYYVGRCVRDAISTIAELEKRIGELEAVIAWANNSLYAWQTKAAEWHAERANGLRNIAATTRRDWTDPKHYSEEDRRANYADARENDQRAGWHEQCRDALQAAITRAHADDLSEEGKGG